ncbi:hypothetical protein scyTo_0003714 [Scyliorhinus torazame]|uniref:26S proteasome non-ATPase regulatory subunit 5 n=1 Tax=Scyliorhinus torazame TaxID=75743 RepID=A0A401PND3_SCYTO|nr:hypothetical protein [Scyliorhinus torazame]
MAAGVSELLREIAELEEPLEELRSLKTAVHSLPLSILRELATGLRFGVLFGLLSSDDREQIDTCVAILDRLLQALDPVYMAQNFKLELQKGLQHSDDNVKILAMSQIGRIVESADAVPLIIGSPELLREMIHSIGGKKISVAKESPHGRQYLAQQGTIDRISNMIVGADSDPFSGFYLPNLVKFFGNLAMVDSPQQICERYPAFIEKVFEMIGGQEPTMIGVGLDTIGILGSCIEGMQVLNKTGSRFHEVLKRLGNISCNAASDIRVRCLDTIASLLSLPNDQQTEDLLGLTESWFQTLHSHPMETFCNMSSQPFPEIHIGAIKIFTAIASQPWGQRLMISTPGFVEYIIDRSAEPDKPSKDAKFELVKTLVDSKTLAEIFGNQYYLQLRTYLREGPYFVKAIATVAVDGE